MGLDVSLMERRSFSICSATSIVRPSMAPMAPTLPGKTSREWQDMQPRYSPDGKSIAFTSDRVGKSKLSGDNIWILRLEDNTDSVTDEGFRLLNGPAWHRAAMSSLAALPADAPWGPGKCGCTIEAALKGMPKAACN